MQGVVEYLVIILLQIYWRISERIFEKRLKSEGITAKSLVFPFLGDSVLTCVSCCLSDKIFNTCCSCRKDYLSDKSRC